MTYLKQIVALLVLVAAVGGLVYWQINREEYRPKPVDYIKVTEIPDGQLVENTKDNFSVTVPKDWYVEIPTTSGNPVSLYSKEGGVSSCKISTYIDSNLKSKEQIISSIKSEEELFNKNEIIQNSIKEELLQEDVVIKNVFETSTFGKIFSAYLLSNTGTYIVSSGPISEKTSVSCEKALNDVLNKLQVER